METVTTHRTCSRCGELFAALGQQNCCGGCRTGRKRSAKNLFGQTLTRRDQQVLMGIYAGQSNQEIATELLLGLGTVKTYTAILFRKLGANSRSELMGRKIRELQSELAGLGRKEVA